MCLFSVHGGTYTPLISALKSLRRVDLNEYEANLVCIAIFRPVIATKNNIYLFLIEEDVKETKS